MAEKGNVFTGARARFSIEGVKVGFARSVTINEAITYEPITTLDNVEVEEFVPTGYEVRFTAQKFKIVGDTLKTRGWFPSIGGNTEEHLENILVSGDLTATIEDTKSGNILATVEQVKVASTNYTVDARGVVGEDMEFVAVRVRDESEI